MITILKIKKVFQLNNQKRFICMIQQKLHIVYFKLFIER